MLLPIHNYFHRFCTATIIGLASLLSVSPGSAIPVRAQISHTIQRPVALEQLLPNWVSQAPSPTPEQTFQPLTWQPFTSTSGHYAVDFPTSPTQFTSTTQVPEGALTWQVAETRMQAIEAGRANSYEYYMVAYTTLSADHLANRDPDELVQAISDAVLLEGELNGNIQLQERILFHNYPARLVIGSVDDQYWVMIVSLVDGRLYTNLAFSEQRDRVVHFFDSFIFTDSPS